MALTYVGRESLRNIEGVSHVKKQDQSQHSTTGDPAGGVRYRCNILRDTSRLREGCRYMHAHQPVPVQNETAAGVCGQTTSLACRINIETTNSALAV